MLKRRRNNRTVRRVETPPTGVDLEKVASSCSYIGSVYHKRNPSFAGRQPRPRPDASLCPSELSNSRKLVESWLQYAVASGNVGRFDEFGYPRLVWYRKGNTVYEARTGSKGSGEYHGYPLRRDEHVMGLQ